MKNTKKETVLTVDELKNISEVLSDMRDTIDLYNQAFNLVPHGQELDQDKLAVKYQALYDLTKSMFYKNQKLMSDLDNVAYTLAENVDEFEVKNTRKQFTKGL